jgi:opacity protein-like surface antigen
VTRIRLPKDLLREGFRIWNSRPDISGELGVDICEIRPRDWLRSVGINSGAIRRQSRSTALQGGACSPARLDWRLYRRHRRLPLGRKRFEHFGNRHGLHSLFPVTRFDAPRADSRLSGAIGGGEIGYNWQFGQWVTGLEADFSYARSASTATYDAPEIGANPATLTSHTTELSWFGTARARLGYLATPDTLLFATGGLAYGQAKVTTGIVPEPTQPCARNVLCSTGTASETLVGWTIGGGLETKIASNWTAKIEYLHFNLGSIGNTATTLTSNTFWRGTKMIGVDSDITGNIVRIGVNYQL